MHKYQFEVFTSPCEVTLYDISKQKADTLASQILKNSKHLELKYTFFNSTSYLSKLNNREEQVLDFETKDILTQTRTLYDMTNGVFDISVGTIKNLHEDLLKQFVGIKNWEIKKDKLVFSNPYTKLDLGGVIKEYAVDKAVQLLKKSKISSALINFGGDLYALGNKPDGSPFSIAIKDPLNPSQKFTSIALSNSALTTSAHYERAGHIIGEKNSILSSTVFGQKALWCGAFSTAYLIDERVELPKGYKSFNIS